MAVTRALHLALLPRGRRPQQAHHAESLATILHGPSLDAAEGIAAFHDRRPPRFPMTVSKDLPTSTAVARLNGDVIRAGQVR